MKAWSDYARHCDVRHFACFLAAALLVIVGLGALNFAGYLEVMDPKVDGLHVPGLFTALELVLAGSLVLILREQQPHHHAHRAVWVVLASVVFLLALAELVTAHERLRGPGPGREPMLAALTVAGATVWLLALGLLRGSRGANRFLLPGLAVWLLAQALGWASPEPGLGVRLARTMLAMAAAGALAVGLTAAVQERARARDGGPDPTKGSFLALATGLVREADPRRLAEAIAMPILALTLVGAVVTLGELDARLVDLNAERNVPTFFSATLFVGAGGLAYLTGHVGFPGERLGLWFKLSGLGFAVFACDELATIHEHLEAKTGVEPGQVFLLPVVAVLLLAGASILRRFRRDRPVRLLLLGGVLGWGLSQALDPLHTEGRPRTFLIIPEELLEMTGSALLAFAFLFILRGVLDRDRRRSFGPEPGPHRDGRSGEPVPGKTHPATSVGLGSAQLNTGRCWRWARLASQWPRVSSPLRR